MCRLPISSLLALAIPALSACGPILGSDDTVSVPNGDGPRVELLASGRHLPASATSITMHTLHFQATNQWVRFKAPIEDARRFAAEMLPGQRESCRWVVSRLDNWPDRLPAGAECGSASGSQKDRRPGITVAVIPEGTSAIVLVFTSIE